MKITDLIETITSGPYPEYTPHQIQSVCDWLSSGSDSIPIEGNRFQLLRKDRTIALQRTNDSVVVGWAVMGDSVEYHGQNMITLKMIYIRQEYRKSIATMLLMNGIRNVVDLPVVVDGAIFADGQRLLDAISKRSNYLPHVYVFDKRTGEKRPYTAGSLTTDVDTCIVLERIEGGIYYTDTLPHGETRRITLECFNGLLTDLLQ